MSVGSTKRGMTAVAFDRLCVSLGGTQVLHEVSAAVEPGEWVAVIGPNGAGKTTLLRSIASLVPFAGSIELLGDDLRSLSHRERARRVALVAQIPTMPARSEAGPFLAAEAAEMNRLPACVVLWGVAARRDPCVATIRNQGEPS